MTEFTEPGFRLVERITCPRPDRDLQLVLDRLGALAARIYHPACLRLVACAWAGPDRGLELVYEAPPGWRPARRPAGPGPAGCPNLEGRLHGRPVPADLPAKLDLLQQVGGAVDAIADAGLAHLDLRPGRLLLGEGGALVLAGLGHAIACRLVGAGWAPHPGGAAPEVFSRGWHRPGSDRYAFAVLAHLVLTGRELYPVPPGLPPNLAAAYLRHAHRHRPPAPEDQPRKGVVARLRHLLDQDPARRSPGCLALVADLEDLRAEQIFDGLPPPDHPGLSRSHHHHLGPQAAVVVG